MTEKTPPAHTYDAAKAKSSTQGGRLRPAFTFSLPVLLRYFHLTPPPQQTRFIVHKRKTLKVARFLFHL